MSYSRAIMCFMNSTRLISAVAASMGLLAWTGVCAGAHTSLVDTDPRADEVVTSVTAVQMEFVDAVLPIGLDVQVTDGGGQQLSLAEPFLEGDFLVVQPLPQLSEGEYDVEWRVVSEDGHPLEGEFSFEVGTRALLPPAPTSTPGASITPVPSIAGSPSVVSSLDPSLSTSPTPPGQADSGGQVSIPPRVLWALAGLVAVALVLAITMTSRRARG